MSLSPYLKPVDFIDTPEVIDTASTNIPASGTATLLGVVASLAATCYRVKVMSTTERAVGLYVGAVGAEVLKAIIGPGVHEIDLSIPIRSRVALRAMENTVVSVGVMCLQFMGST